MMDVFGDLNVEEVVMMTASQIGKTEILNNVCAYYIDQDPAPMLVIQPNVEPMAKAWSTDRLAPMIRDCPRLRRLVHDPKSRDSGNTILHKSFRGGHITVTGANSPASLASRPIRIVLCDEVDRYDESVGSEGDAIELAKQRTATFWNRKILLTSTPTLQGFSRIEREFARSDQRYFHVPCPDCGVYQKLIWGNLRWDEGDPESARYACESCGSLWSDARKHLVIKRGRWVAENPGSRVVGFHLNALYSPWARWAALVREWLDAQQDQIKLQSFVNLKLGETWQERGGGIDPEGLLNRREPYAAPVPAGVGILTGGVDVQADRLMYVVRGWGASEESWLIECGTIVGDPTVPSTWDALEAVLTKRWDAEIGGTMGLDTVCIDSGFHTDEVYRFTVPRFPRRVFAVKGVSTHGAPLVNRKPSKVRSGAMVVRLFLVGTDTAKDTIYGRIKMLPPGPYAMHFPLTATADYFRELTAERVMRRKRDGKWVRVYEVPRGERNEALDCEVYALAAQRLATVPVERLGEAAERRAERAPGPPPPEPPAHVGRDLAREKLSALRRRGRGGWLS